MSNSTHRVQGLNNDEVAADWPAITEREVSWLRERFAPLAGAGRLLWHSPRPMSAAAIVETDGKRVFVKRHHGSVRTAASLAEEHRFIRHLADRSA